MAGFEQSRKNLDFGKVFLATIKKLSLIQHAFTTPIPGSQRREDPAFLPPPVEDRPAWSEDRGLPGKHARGDENT